MSAIQNHKALWRKKRQCCDAKDVKRKTKTASHVKIAKSKCRIELCFLSNGYLDWFIDKQIKIFLNKRDKILLQKTSKKGRLTFEEFFFTCLTLVKRQYN